MADDRTPEEIERDLARARDDLAERVSSLDREVRARVDVKARARVATEKARQRARDVADQARRRAQDGAHQASAEVRAHPERYLAIAAVAGIGLGLLLGGRRPARLRVRELD